MCMKVSGYIRSLQLENGDRWEGDSSIDTLTYSVSEIARLLL